MTQATDIKGLAELIRRIEEQGSRSGAGGQGSAHVPTAWGAIDEALCRGGERGLASHALHEWFGADAADPPRDRPPLCIFQHLVRQACRAGASQGRRWVTWIGRRVWPYPWGLMAPGGRAAELLPCSILVDPPDASSRLWATDLALRCQAMAAVVADGRGLGMAASRRLQLAAREGGTLVLLARPLAELHRLSAAATRWLVRPQPSRDEQPRWRVQLLRCKSAPLLAVDGQGSDSSHDWHLQWNDATGTVHLVTDVGDGLTASPTGPQHHASAPAVQRPA